MPVPVSLLAQAGALTSGEVSGDAKGSGGMVVFVGDYPVDVTPDATVADLRKALPDGRRVTLRYQGRELRDSDELADVGVCAEARVDVCRSAPVLTFNDRLPHPRVELSADLRTARFSGGRGASTPCFVVSSEQVQSGVPFRVRIHTEAHDYSYYGVGVSPAVDPSRYDQCRVADDGGGCGVSINQNGCVYGAPADYVVGSRGAAAEISLGSELVLKYDRAEGKLEISVFASMKGIWKSASSRQISVLPRNAKAGGAESAAADGATAVALADEPTTVAVADVSRFADEPLYAAVFFCGAEVAVSFVDPHRMPV
eukprot:TRINITY_DN5401_c0_g1_i1.p1 TRINITY_DN5401_c0_g1~~TRINITY_DN5401_c0_g1_i1.p1  ORF type:complete len:313 (+),score=75.23 TRINITY_DN5401_c0_g1_i1:69-1007(+)